jgi:hypothetical protein
MNVPGEATAKGLTALIYAASAVALLWYGLKGGDEVIYLFWALVFFIHATGRRVSMSVIATRKGDDA